MTRNKSPLKMPTQNIYDILRYRIGYCRKGPYSGKIIIPSYDENLSLNYFVARAYYEEDKWKNRKKYAKRNPYGGILNRKSKW